MKPLLTAAIPVVATLIFMAALLLVNGDPSSISPTFNIPSPDQILAVSKPTPVYFDKSSPTQPLQPGVYQTYPYTIILIVPGGSIGDRCFIEIPNANSKIPSISPDLKVIPMSRARQ